MKYNIFLQVKRVSYDEKKHFELNKNFKTFMTFSTRNKNLTKIKSYVRGKSRA